MKALFVYTLLCSGLFFTVLGLFVVLQTMVRPKKAPMDNSNRINHLRLVWFALNSPHRFVEIKGVDGHPAFPWLAHDEGDNVKGVM